MLFEGKLDIHLISADLTQFVPGDDSPARQGEMKTNVKIVIDGITVGSSAVETGPQPVWRENLSVELELSSSSELRAELYSHSQAQLQGETVLAQAITGLADLRSRGHDKEIFKATLELSPKGQIFLEVRFHPRQVNLETMQENNFHHRGHNYKGFSFCDVIKCAFCQVSANQQIFTSVEI